MRRFLRVLGWILGGLVAVLVVIVAVVAIGVNTGVGHRTLEAAARLGGVEITGLAGRVPDDLSAERITVADAKGVWLEIDGLHLAWSPTALLHREIRAELLSARLVHVARYPSGGGASNPPAKSSSSGGFDWKVAVDKVKADRIELPEITLTLDGHAIYQTAGMDVTLAATTPDAMGQGPAALQAHLLGPLGQVKLDASLDGKGLTTKANGTVDLVALAGDLSLGIDRFDYAGVSATRFQVDAKGDAKAATFHAVATGLKLPGSQPTVLGDGPVTLDGTWNGADSAIAAKLTAGAMAANGLKLAAEANWALTTESGKLDLAIDRLAVAGVGASHVALQATGGTTALDLHGVVTGLVAPGVTPVMLGDAPLVLDAHYKKGGAPELVASLAGDTVNLTTSGTLPISALGLDFHLVLPKLAAFAPDIAGQADLAGHIAGAFDDFAVKAQAKAGITASGTASTIDGTIDASGLPSKPSGAVSVKGAYGGQPVALDASAAIGPDGQPVITIAKADWQAVTAHGAITLAPDGGLPTGQLVVDAKRLPSTNAGTARATIDLLRTGAPPGATPVLKVMAEVSGLAVQGTRLARSVLAGTVTDPLGKVPVLKADLTLSDVTSGTYRQSARLDVSGPANALAIKLNATGTASLAASATLDVAASRLNVASLSGTAQGQTLRLAAPTTITYAPQVTLGRTRLTLGGSSLDLSGRVSPTLDLTASLRAVPAELVKLVDPSMVVEGILTADARLQGTPERPTGTLRLSGSGLRPRSPPGVPAMRIDAQAAFKGGFAQLDARLAAGTRTQLTLAGTVPIATGGAWDLTARGGTDLVLLDPFLTGAGAQTRGQLAIDATITGTEPRPSGTLTLHDGSVSVPAQGARLSDIEMVLQAQSDRVVVRSLTAKAGGGTLSGTGSVGVAAPMPVALKLVARNASPIASDLLTAVFDADFSLTGALQTAMAAVGTIDLKRADINIPQSLPSSLPQLDIRKRNAKPAPPPAPPVPISLDLTLKAPGQVFVRGRGLDAEMGGQLHVGGSASAPKPDGGFSLRRGQFSLAGQTLNFTTGRVGFDGSVPIDPSLNFVATAYTSSVAATLTVTGTATHPKIVLSSVPEVPQDEVLAQLLFHRSAAELGPLQLAEIAAGLAQLADVGGSGGLDPLGSIRKGLGLDVLSVGGAPGSSSPTVEAGRNLGHGVYVGAKQSTAGSGSQATVRLDLATGLRLEADLGVAPAQSSTSTPGAPPTGNQVGITYEFQY